MFRGNKKDTERKWSRQPLAHGRPEILTKEEKEEIRNTFTPLKKGYGVTGQKQDPTKLSRKELAEKFDVNVATITRALNAATTHKQIKRDAIIKKLRIELVRKTMIKYKGGECSRCGYNKNPKAMDFHHKNKNEKEIDFARVLVGGQITNFFDKDYNVILPPSFLKELDKCILVCATCHREIHAEEFKLDLPPLFLAEYTFNMGKGRPTKERAKQIRKLEKIMFNGQLSPKSNKPSVQKLNLQTPLDQINGWVFSS